MASRDHIFCPVSGSLLSVNKEKKVLNCLSSGYSRTFEGAARRRARGRDGRGWGASLPRRRRALSAEWHATRCAQISPMS